MRHKSGAFCDLCKVESNNLVVENGITQCAEKRDCNKRLRERALTGSFGPRMNWIRFNKEEGSFELRCTSCNQWQTLDLSMWNPHSGLRTCRACQRAKARRAHQRKPQPERLFCKRGLHRWVPSNVYVPPSGKGKACRLCKNERDRQYIAETREYLKRLAA